ncbi:response regulator transcription factor [Henriciella marina]|uniref:response regulator transcription factor n=1 Tax=Henriciella marina TaxID=453851 RepID=UPI00037364CF|nr:response regulator transcription factor [Henriciella marina]
MRVLVIDDEQTLLDTIKLNWPDPESRIVTATSFSEAKPHIYASRLADFDCVILDLQLPDASGSTILSEIKQIADIPVMMVSGWGDTKFRADTLNRGADDYVMKPVGVSELHARAQRLTGRRAPSRHSAGALLYIGDCRFHPLARELSGDKTTIALTGAESALLESLARARGGAVTRQDLYMKAFGREGRSGDKSLETYIGRVRRRITEAGDDGDRRVQSVRGVGYRLLIEEMASD